MAAPKTLREAILFFADSANCHKAVREIRWPDGVVRCPHCGSEKVTYLENARVWKCYGKHPKAKFSLKVGTLFEDSAIGLEKWLPALWLVVNCKNGISSYELARALGVTQKTAWFMLSRLRMALHDEPSDKLKGHVEADETFVGGRARFMHKDRRQRVMGNAMAGRMGKAAVMGLLERTSPDSPSQIRTMVVPNVRRPKLQLEMARHIKMDGTATIYTDALKSYERPSKWGRTDLYVHKVVDHAVQYVDGVVHTNGLENYWSLLKRTLRGTYVSVQPFHLFRYLDEQAFRFNNRKADDSSRFWASLKGILGKRLTYLALTGSELPRTC